MYNERLMACRRDLLNKIHELDIRIEEAERFYKQALSTYNSNRDVVRKRYKDWWDSSYDYRNEVELIRIPVRKAEDRVWWLRCRRSDLYRQLENIDYEMNPKPISRPTRRTVGNIYDTYDVLDYEMIAIRGIGGVKL